MIVYKVKRLFGGMKRYIKRRTSDKNKRFYMKFKRFRGHRYWWKEVE